MCQSKGVESEWFRVDSGVRQGILCSLGCIDEGGADGDGNEESEIPGGEEGREWRLTGLFYVDNLVLCVELEEDLRVMVGWFNDVCRRKVRKSFQVRPR